MPPLPDNAHPAAINPAPLENNPGSRPISDDDLCACAHTFFIVPVNSASAA